MSTQQPDDRWYMVDKNGMATLCTDREDAEKEAKDANLAWPHTAPHRAVQLVEVGTSAAELHPSPQEGMVGGWRLIATAPESQMVVVGWLDPEDAEHPERHDFDLLEDGCWRKWNEHAEYVEIIGGHGVSYTPPYTVWMPVGPIPTTMAQCKFDLAWRGPCKAKCDADFCEQHAAVKCCVCGAQATHECDHTGQFVCGAPLCNNCEGHTDTSKPAGGWGVMNHTHRQKDPS